MASWQEEWKELYKRDTQSFEPFYLWLMCVKGWSQADVQDFGLDDDDAFHLLEKYGNDSEVEKLSLECQKEIGI